MSHYPRNIVTVTVSAVACLGGASAEQLASISLPPGTWTLKAFGVFTQSAGTAFSLSDVDFAIRPSVTDGTLGTDTISTTFPSSTPTASSFAVALSGLQVTISTTSPYYLVATPTAGQSGSPTFSGTLTAFRSGN